MFSTKLMQAYIEYLKNHFENINIILNESIYFSILFLTAVYFYLTAGEVRD